MLHGSEAWPLIKENEMALQWAEMPWITIDGEADK